MCASVVLGLFGCVALAPSKSNWAGECFDGFDRDVALLAGSDAIDCRMLPRDFHQAEQTWSRECTRQALAASKAFKTGYASYGDDSLFCAVAVRSGDGHLWSVFYDADITGGSKQARPALWISQCTDLVFEPGTIGPGSFFNLTGCSRDPDTESRVVAARKHRSR